LVLQVYIGITSLYWYYKFILVLQVYIGITSSNYIAHYKDVCDIIVDQDVW